MTEVRPISATDARTVRHPVLREGLPPESAILDRDDDPSTSHFGAFEHERLVAVATFFPEDCPGRPESPAWRLRGMATLPEARGRGAGRALVERGARLAREAAAELLWCQARVTARGFYAKLGFSAEGDPFELPRTGRHFLMIKEL